MAQIVGKRDCFREVFVKRQCARDCAADRGHLNGMGQARTQMIAGPVQKNLCLVLEPAKGARMNDPCAIALKFCAVGMAALRVFSAARSARFLGKRRKRGALGRFHLIAGFVAALLSALPKLGMATGDGSEARPGRSLPSCRHFHVAIIR